MFRLAAFVVAAGPDARFAAGNAFAVLRDADFVPAFRTSFSGLDFFFATGFAFAGVVRAGAFFFADVFFGELLFASDDLATDFRTDFFAAPVFAAPAFFFVIFFALRVAIARPLWVGTSVCKHAVCHVA